MTALPHRLTTDRAPQLGLIVLQSDETIELDFRRLLPEKAELLVSRIPSGAEVTPETLAAMEGDLARAASLFPQGVALASLGYACTSGAAQIGPETVSDHLRAVHPGAEPTNPVIALIAACRALGINRLAVLSPYIEPVSRKLFDRLDTAGIATPVFGSFEIADEARVARIDTASIIAAATTLAEQGGFDALFLSCTNLRTLDAIPALEAQTGLPVLSSNLVLAWHMAQLAGIDTSATAPGRLLSSSG
ncbi:maleate cis-trans isomerase family protein [Thetidibacter halocola]|uniref:Asp/Glu racemase n=1 Tax=Thetidibacter halocola TaxID=2827239 RepID=A0A8J8B8F4_9RHOB|nr:Asp/Glu racemase [Thetidibacter halocola]MBS0125447.1 Asp/Glu racemase [Thetidibacter halocola]